MRISEPIKLRWKPLADGRESAYLDISISGTRRRKEFLRVYRGGTLGRRESRDAERLASAICQKRLDEYNLARSGVTALRPHRLFVPYYADRCEDEALRPSTRVSWRTSLGHIRRYLAARGIDEGSVTIGDIDNRLCRDYLSFLLYEEMPTAINRGKGVANGRRSRQSSSKAHLLPSTAALVFAKFKACLSKAVSDGHIPYNPANGIQRPRQQQSRRTFLDIGEVRALMATPFPNDVVCRAFLFSCLTGMRYSDISLLSWDMVSTFDSHHRVTFAQRKTGGQMYLDISDLAFGYMGQRSDGLVFAGLPLPPSCNAAIAKWVKVAGIQKRVTFHSARHTAAVAMLTAGADIYTVSKVLGHTSLSSTQVYADIVDGKRRSAVDALAALVGDDRGTEM